MSTSTFDGDERSTSQSRPIDLFTIATPTKIYNITSHETDVMFGGVTYLATTASRGNFALQPDSAQNELVIYLPLSHEFVQRFASGIPEMGVTVTMRRLQALSAQAAQFWTGYAQSLSVDGHTAMIRVPSLTADAFKTQLPTLGAHVTCNHRLFDGRCAPNPGGEWPAGIGAGGGSLGGGPAQFPFQIGTFISSVSADGMTLTLSTVGGNPDQWSQYGRIVLDTGEARLVTSQIGTTIQISKPFLSAAGFAILEAGCDHSFATCVAKFDNVYNFGGHPRVSSDVTPWTPNGLGIVVQI